MFIYNLVFAVGTVQGQEQDPILVKRSLEAIEVLAQDLLAFFPDDPGARLLHELALSPSRFAESNLLYPPTARMLENALKLCLVNPQIIRSSSFAQFLCQGEDNGEGNGGDGNDLGRAELNADASKSAIDFILQPLESTSVYIPCRRFHFVDVFVRKGETLIWRFSVGGGYDIRFGVLFRALGGTAASPDPQSDKAAFAVVEEVSKTLFDDCMSRGFPVGELQPSPGEGAAPEVAVAVSRVAGASSEQPYCQNSYYPRSTGFARLVWDNSYSRINGKHVTLIVQSIPDETMQAAFEAAEDLANKTSLHSKAYRCILDSDTEVDVSVDGPWKSLRIGGVLGSAAVKYESMSPLSPAEGGGAAVKGDGHLLTLSQSAPGDRGIVQQYVDRMPYNEHRRIVMDGGSATLNNRSPEMSTDPGTARLEEKGDIVLDDSFDLCHSKASPPGDVSQLDDSAGWASSALSSIKGYALPLVGAANNSNSSNNEAVQGTDSPQRPVSNSLLKTSLLGSLIGYYYPVNPNALYKSSMALLEAVRRGLPGMSSMADNGDNSSARDVGQLADLLRIGQLVDDLEDKNAILTAERDQARAAGVRSEQALKMTRDDVVSIDHMLTRQEQETTIWKERALAAEDELKRLGTLLEATQASERQLKSQLMDMKHIKAQIETRMESVLLEQSVWGSTRDGVQRQLSDAFSRAEESFKNEQMATRRAEELEKQADVLTQRIIELELALSKTKNEKLENCGIAGEVAEFLDRNHVEDMSIPLQLQNEIKQYASRLSELQAQLEINDCQYKIEIAKTRQQLRQNSATVALCKTEAAECRMMVDLYRDKIKLLKAQKKVLITELRNIRMLGVHQGHSSEELDVRSAKGEGTPMSGIKNDKLSRLDSAPLCAKEDSKIAEKGINFSVLQLSVAEGQANNTGNDDVIDFTSNEQEVVAPMTRTSGPVNEAPSSITMAALTASLRRSRLRQQTVSVIMQDDPGNSSLRGLFNRLSEEVFLLEQKLMAYSGMKRVSASGTNEPGLDNFATALIANDEDEEEGVMDLPSHDEWMNLMQDDRAV